MTGKIAFEAWGNIDPAYILEAAPDSETVPVGVAVPNTSKKSPKGHRPLGGWVAAAVCAIVALGVYLGAMWLGQGAWQPPATTGEGTETAETDETVVTDPGETETEPPIETPEVFCPFLTPDYVVEKIDGQCYLNFYKGNRTSGIDHISYVTFESLEDMFTSIYEGDFTRERLLDLYGFNTLTNQGYRILDIWELATPILPEGCEMEEIWWEGENYLIYFSHPSYPNSYFMNICENQKVTGWAEALVEDQRQDAEELTVDGIPAIITNTSVGNRKVVYLSLTDEATGREIYVSAEYPPPGYYSENLEAMVAEVSPTKLQIWGTQGEKEYHISLYDYVDESTLPKLTKNYVLSFGLEDFVPPATEEIAIDTDVSYEVEKIDGVYYLTFPEYDFSALDTYLPENLSNLNSPHFSTLWDMYDTFMGVKRTLSLTEIIQYRLLMDENNRVRLPDLDNLLTPVIPDALGEMTSFTFYEAGNYAGQVWDQADGVPIYFGGGITEAGWQEGYDFAFESFYGNGEADSQDVTVVNGFFDGLPCTFYEYTNGSGAWSLCHVTRTEGGHRQDMFVTFYDSVLALIAYSDNHFTLEYLENYPGCFIRILGIRDELHYTYNFGGYGIGLGMDSFAIPSKKLLDQMSAIPYNP